MTTAVDALFEESPFLDVAAKHPLAKLFEARVACQKLRAGGAHFSAVHRFATTLRELYGAALVAVVYARRSTLVEVATPTDILASGWAARLSSIARPLTTSRAVILANSLSATLFRHPAVGKAAVVPLDARTTTVDGALLLAWTDETPLPDDERMALTLLGQELASALEGALLDERLARVIESKERLLEDLQAQRNRLEGIIVNLDRARQLERRRADHLREVSRLGTILGSELELPSLLQRVAEALLSITGGEYSALVLPDSQGDNYTIGGSAGCAVENIDCALGSIREHGLIDLVVRQNQTIFINDARLHPRLRHLIPEQRSLIAVPLRWKERTLGALVIGHSEANRFDTQDLELVVTLGGQAASAIEHARLTRQGQIAAELRAIVEQMPQGIWATDPEGRITLTNAACLRLHGFSESDPRPQTLAELTSRVRIDEAAGNFCTFSPLRSEESTTEAREKRSVLLNRITLRASERAELDVTIASDVTEFDRREQSKSEFLSLVAHELRTPLTPMAMLLQSLERKAREGAVDLDAIVRTRRQVTRLTKLISDLLDVSQAGSDSLGSSSCPFDLSQLASEVVDTFRSTSPKHAIELSFADAPVHAIGDKSRLEQVIVNLLDNAVKYSPTGGSIDVRVERTPTHAVVSVTDQGIGIPEEQQASLFTRFFRADNASNRKFQGFGLGLHLAETIVRKHGGSMTVRSEVGRGSRFAFTLPLADARALDSFPKTAPRLLLVDDDPDILHVVGDILEAEGYEVVRAHDGAEALRQVEVALPDLVLLDLMMPVTDGWEVLGRLRNRERWCQTPIVVLSAHHALPEQASLLHADAYLGKPFEMDELIRKVGELLPLTRPASAQPHPAMR